MRPGAARALSLLPKYLEVDAKPIRARELLQQIGRGEGWLDDSDELAERAEEWEGPFLRHVREELSALNSLGRVSYFSINSSSPNVLQGSAFVEPRDTPKVAKEKRARSRIGEYRSVLATLTPEDFEALCGGILALLGVENVTITPSSRDEGIDFYGHMRAEKLIRQESVFPNFGRQVSMWLLGQAKHYTKAKVTTPDMRNLVGAVELAKSQAFSSLGSKYEDLRIRVCDPIFFLFFTTGRLTADSWRLAERSGIVALDGEMVADLLASREVGVVSGDYSDTDFRTWLREQTEGQRTRDARGG